MICPLDGENGQRGLPHGHLAPFSSYESLAFHRNGWIGYLQNSLSFALAVLLRSRKDVAGAGGQNRKDAEAGAHRERAPGQPGFTANSLHCQIDAANGPPEPAVKPSALHMTDRLKEGGLGNRGIEMKKIIAAAAIVCAFGAFTSLPQADATRQATAEPTAMLALMQVPPSLKIEAYEAI